MSTKISWDPSVIGLVILILKLVMWMNWLDISVTIIQNFGEFRSLKAELLLRQIIISSFWGHLGWTVRKVCACEGFLGTEQGNLEYQ